MGEAIITRASGGEAEAILPIVPGSCTLLITVKDSLNRPAVGIMVNCKDGASWYNYTTNEKGQTMFSTNSGSANITAFNRYKNGIWILDQKQDKIDVDAPLSTSKKINLKFNGYNIGQELNFISSAGSYPTDKSLPTGNYAFMVSKKIHAFVGGGGSSGYSDGKSGIKQGGGAGGANDADIDIVSGQLYYATVGKGGAPVSISNNGQSGFWQAGGTSSFYNISASGGSANRNGSGKYVTGGNDQDSALNNFGGGGRSGESIGLYGDNSRRTRKGNPGGGEGGLIQYVDDGEYSTPYLRSHGGNGVDGLGGGGGGAPPYVYSYGFTATSGKGGNGCIRIKFLE